MVELEFKPQNFYRENKFTFRGKESRMTSNFSTATLDTRKKQSYSNNPKEARMVDQGNNGSSKKLSNSKYIPKERLQDLLMDWMWGMRYSKVSRMSTQRNRAAFIE